MQRVVGILLDLEKKKEANQGEGMKDGAPRPASCRASAGEETILAASPTWRAARARRACERASERESVCQCVRTRAWNRPLRPYHPVRRGGHGGTSGAQSHGLWYFTD